VLYKFSVYFYVLCLRKLHVCAAEAIMFSLCPVVPCQHRHFFASHEYWTAFDKIWGCNCYCQLMKWFNFGRNCIRDKVAGYDRKFESTSNRCCHVVDNFKNYTVHAARCVRRAGKSITHVQRRRHHMTARSCLVFTARQQSNADAPSGRRGQVWTASKCVTSEKTTIPRPREKLSDPAVNASTSAVYFSWFSTWEGVSQLMGVKLFFSFSMVQCTILQQNGKYNTIPTFLFGAFL